MFAGSEASRAMQEIRIRDRSFDMNIFLRSIKVNGLYLAGALHCHGALALSRCSIWAPEHQRAGRENVMRGHAWGTAEA